MFAEFILFGWNKVIRAMHDMKLLCIVCAIFGIRYTKIKKVFCWFFFFSIFFDCNFFLSLYFLFFSSPPTVPPMLMIQNQLVGSAIGQKIMLECQSEAYPKSINYWMKNESIITKGKCEDFFSSDVRKFSSQVCVRYIERLIACWHQNYFYFIHECFYLFWNEKNFIRFLFHFIWE